MNSSSCLISQNQATAKSRCILTGCIAIIICTAEKLEQRTRRSARQPDGKSRDDSKGRVWILWCSWLCTMRCPRTPHWLDPQSRLTWQRRPGKEGWAWGRFHYSWRGFWARATTSKHFVTDCTTLRVYNAVYVCTHYLKWIGCTHEHHPYKRGFSLPVEAEVGAHPDLLSE